MRGEKIHNSCSLSYSIMMHEQRFTGAFTVSCCNKMNKISYRDLHRLHFHIRFLTHLWKGKQFFSCFTHLTRYCCSQKCLSFLRKTTWIGRIAIARNCFVSKRALVEFALWWCCMMRLGPSLRKICGIENSTALPLWDTSNLRLMNMIVWCYN